MIEYYVQNFSWPTFFLALAVFVLVSNVFNMVLAYYRLRKANKIKNEAEAKLTELKNKFIEKDKELNKLLSKKDNKKQ